MMKLKKYGFSVCALFLTIIVGLYYAFGGFFFKKEEISANVRTVAVDDSAMDYQAVLNEFEDSTLVQEKSLTTFTGYQTLNPSLFEEFDNVSVEEIEAFSGCKVSYAFTYDSDSNVVTLSAEMVNEYGEIAVDTLSGVGFINESGEIDAVMNVDGEGVLLSEMRSAGLIQNCGWFANLFKKVVQAVAVAAVVVATAAVVVATAGAAATALVAVGVGMAGSTAVAAGGAALGIAAGAIFAATVGRAAVEAGTAIGEVVGEGAEWIIDKTTNAVIAFIMIDVEYVVQEIKETSALPMERGRYRFVKFTKDGNAYITIKTFDYLRGVWGLRLGLSTYSLKDDAYLAAMDAGDGKIPRSHPKHSTDTNGKNKKGVYFEHYHAYSHIVAYDTCGFGIKVGHACYGVPTINR